MSTDKRNHFDIYYIYNIILPTEQHVMITDSATICRRHNLHRSTGFAALAIITISKYAITLDFDF